MSRKRLKARRGDLVELTWLDAVFYTDPNESMEAATERGGEPCLAIGYLSYISRKTVVLCGELDKENNPARDFNCIPRGMVVRVKILKRSCFGDRRNA